MKLNFSDLLNQTRLIAILRGIPAECLGDVMQALYDGGIRLAEITFDAAGKIPVSETEKHISRAASLMEGKMLIGAGTVLSEEQINTVRDSGGTFIISPHTDADLIEKTKNAGLISIPGAMTVSEIVCAHKAGADYIKLFPASLYGPDFFRHVSAPLPHIKMLAVSGIKLDEIPAYLQAGAVGFGLGRDIASPELCRSQDFSAVRERAAMYIHACREALQGEKLCLQL